MTIKFMFFLAVAASLTPRDARGWTDADSTRRFELLDGNLPYNAAERSCRQKGMVLSDLRFLDATDREVFLKSSLLDEVIVHPVTRHAGAKIGYLWQSSSIIALSVVNATESAQALVLHRADGKTRSALEYQGAREFKARAICMSVPAFWYRCSAEYRCDFQSATGDYSTRYQFMDFGETQSEGLKRIVDTTSHPRWSVQEGKCGIVTSSMNCFRLLPE